MSTLDASTFSVGNPSMTIQLIKSATETYIVSITITQHTVIGISCNAVSITIVQLQYPVMQYDWSQFESRRLFQV